MAITNDSIAHFQPSSISLPNFSCSSIITKTLQSSESQSHTGSYGYQSALTDTAEGSLALSCFGHVSGADIMVAPYEAVSVVCEGRAIGDEDFNQLGSLALSIEKAAELDDPLVIYTPQKAMTPTEEMPTEQEFSVRSFRAQPQIFCSCTGCSVNEASRTIGPLSPDDIEFALNNADFLIAVHKSHQTEAEASPLSPSGPYCRFQSPTATHASRATLCPDSNEEPQLFSPVTGIAPYGFAEQSPLEISFSENALFMGLAPPSITLDNDCDDLCENNEESLNSMLALM